MPTVRLLHVLTMLLMLPWGAYVSIPSGAGEGADLQLSIAAYPTSPDPGWTGATGVPPTEASVHKRCRIAMLPGSPCGPDRALVASGDEASDVDLRRDATVSPEPFFMAGFARPPPREPPRPL